MKALALCQSSETAISRQQHKCKHISFKWIVAVSVPQIWYVLCWLSSSRLPWYFLFLHWSWRGSACSAAFIHVCVPLFSGGCLCVCVCGLVDSEIAVCMQGYTLVSVQSCVTSNICSPAALPMKGEWGGVGGWRGWSLGPSSMFWEHHLVSTKTVEATGCSTYIHRLTSNLISYGPVNMYYSIKPPVLKN